MPLIVLWDIDHTLIDNAGVSKEIYAAAFTASTGAPPVAAASTEGRTDRLIMRDMFLRHDLPIPDWELIEDVLARAGQDRGDDLARRGSTLPGVGAALKAASVQDGWVSSVLTGNIAANARVKLSASTSTRCWTCQSGPTGPTPRIAPILWPSLAGVAGESSVIAACRTRGRLCWSVTRPWTSRAALTTGSGIIAVATGIHSSLELAAAGASVVLPDLSDTTVLLALLEASAAR